MRGKIFLLAVLLSTICNVCVADVVSKAQARRIISGMDQMERKINQTLALKPPTGASPEFVSEWQNMLRKTEKVKSLCKPIRLYAEKIEAGDESDETFELLSKYIHKLGLAQNEWEDALDNLKRIKEHEDETANNKPITTTNVQQDEVLAPGRY